jgi:AcrR family transcriptional regulator
MKAEAAGGRVSLYKRPNSRFWQCQCTVGGQAHRVSSKTENLADARRFATHWYVELSEGIQQPDEIAGVAAAPGGATIASYLQQPGKTDRILAAAISLVAEEGFRNAQMNAVAERAGLALSTVYRHFPSKNQLMRDVVDRVASREVNMAAGAAVSEGSAPVRLEHAVRIFAERAVRGRKLAHALVAEPVDAEIEIDRVRYRRRLVRVYEKVIAEGIAEGSIPKQEPDLSAACIVGALFEGLVGPLVQVDGTDAEQSRRVDHIVAFCMRGVAGGKPP